MKKIIYNKDGRLFVIHPIRNTYPVIEKLTDDQVLKRAMKDVPSGAKDVQVVEESAIPTDRTFRAAWVSTPGLVNHDMAKCLEIKKDVLRSERKPLLEALDLEFMMALEQGKSTADITAKKQALRDVTKHPELLSAKTPDQLKDIHIGKLIKQS
jgi:hypothetical protein